MSLSNLPTPFGAVTLLLAATAATAHGTLAHQGRVAAQEYPTTSIQWQSCSADINAVAALDVDCGTLTVPLDYTAPDSTDTLELSLVRVPAVNKPAKHSILFNFGGPGAEARHTLAELADMLQAVTGGEHDLIAWDPRGTAETLTFSCFANATDRAAFNSQFYLGNASDVARGAIWAAAKNYADICAEYPEAQERAPLISTAFTARDAMQIVDAVEEDGLLRYWGLSYGTDLGVTLAALFPERVDKVLIDGVFNPTQYFYERTDSEGFASADDTFSDFFRECVSTPDACALARSHPNTTAKQLESAAYDLIEELKYRPIAHRGAVLGYQELKSVIRFALYTPYTWVTLDSILDAFFAEPRNETLAGDALNTFLSAFLGGIASANDAGVGIECVDKAPRSNSFDVINAAFDQAQAASRLLGDSLFALIAGCAQWTLEPRERYMGGFESVKPRKPLLVIGNTYDSATSIKSARNISETIEGSVLLEHGGVGHTSIQQPSLCTARAIQSFFRNGTLPKPNTLCAPVATPFRFAVSGPTWQDLFPQLGFEPPSSNGTQAARVKRRGHIGDVLKNIGQHPGRLF
ncbi:TAP-like protein-domain-containing protein [Hypoxylon argillaceum]|nr:TAP-like protein-domain-containing protein [Hypoxylon argillaceum]